MTKDEEIRDYMAIEQERQEAKARVALAEYEAEDERRREAARLFLPRVIVKEYPAGEFLEFDKFSAPRRLIEGISVTYHGRAPYMDPMPLGYGLARKARASQSAVITVTMASGNEHEIKCDRHVQDLLLDALIAAWKGERNECGNNR